MTLREAQLTIAVNGYSREYGMQAWFDFDGPDARQNADRLLLEHGDMAWLGHELREESVHVLGFGLLGHGAHRVLAEHYHADVTALRNWHKRGYPSLRVTRRRRDHFARGYRDSGRRHAWFAGRPSKVAEADDRALAAILVYLSAWEHWSVLAELLRLVPDRREALLTARAACDAYVQPVKRSLVEAHP